MKNLIITGTQVYSVTGQFMILTNAKKNGKNLAIFRSLSQLRTDLSNSGLVAPNATDNQVRLAIRNAKGATIEGNLLSYDEGHIFTYEKDGKPVETTAKSAGISVVDGFLTIGVSRTQQQFEAMVEAELSLASVGANTVFGAVGIDDDSDNESEEKYETANEYIDGNEE